MLLVDRFDGFFLSSKLVEEFKGTICTVSKKGRGPYLLKPPARFTPVNDVSDVSRKTNISKTWTWTLDPVPEETGTRSKL